MKPANVKSSNSILSFANKGKLDDLDLFITEYKRVVIHFVNMLWEIPIIRPLLDNTFKVDTWLSARMIQCAGKQASAIVRGARKKQEKRLFIINKFNAEGKFKKARKLQTIYDNTKVSKPKLDIINPELDSRFIEIELDSNNFSWVTITSIGNKLKLVLPFKMNKHFNKLNALGKLKEGVIISNRGITFIFDIPITPKK